MEYPVEKNTILFSPDSPAHDVYVLKQGEVELYHQQNGKKVIFETLFPGDIFGDFGVGKTSYYAVTTRQSFVCRTPTNEFLAIVKAHPEIALRLMRVLAEKTSDYERKIASLSQPAKEQILHEIQRLHEKNRRSVFAKMFHIPLRISHQKLAEKTGLNRVTVTKLLGELRNEGRIKIQEKTGEIQVIKGFYFSFT
ncbi:Crp/Fnr family transcriptional regulator [Candidatus Gracilibacteria bacterium]|nr:Crp/Fnr family transcriptional regulator [Candidatus Gracilibacteria bacterium]MCF7818997.1 Crp/Fnr family transcriptional regulator [Candidatus Gracilibacteria bacterium]